MTKWHKFLLLPYGDKLLLWESWLTLLGSRLALSTLPLNRLRGGVLERTGAAPAGLPERVAWAVNAAAAAVPKATCLVKALAGRRILRRRGIASTIRLGVALDDSRGFEAHAWLECDGRAILGQTGRERYTELTSLEP